MTKLVWGADGERFFEAGVDRGVLYAPGTPGVPWNGLKAVKEAPSGGEPQPFYVDGMKYANLSTAEEFAATLDAFSSPPEFAVCDGNVQLAAGLVVTQQPRKSFDLSYRTKVGNDLNGLDGGYKLHLVYNALAAAAGRDNNTMSNAVDPMGLSWDISTRPPVASGYKPTAHMVIESKKTPAGLLAYIEDILYGSTTATPSMPTQSDLFALFLSEGPIIATNLATNPSFEATAGLVTIRTNLAQDPRATAFHDLANFIGWRNTRWFGSTGGGSYSLITNAIGPSGTGITSFARKTWTVAPVNNGDTGFDTTVGVNGRVVTAGVTYTVSGYLRPSSAGKFGAVKIRWFNSAGALISSTSSNSSTLVALAWNRISVTATAPVGAVIMAPIIDIVGGSIWAVGETLDGTGLLVEEGSVLNEYFDGAKGVVGDFTHIWTGTINASVSQQQVLEIIGVYATESNRRVFSSSEWSSKPNNRSLRITPHAGGVSNSKDSFANLVHLIGPLLPNTTYTVRIILRLVAPLIAPEVNALSFRAFIGAAAMNFNYQKVAPNAAGVHEVIATFTTLADSTLHFFRIMHGGLSDGSNLDVWADEFSITQGMNTQLSYFDGNTPDADGVFYSWEGVPNASKSFMKSWN